MLETLRSFVILFAALSCCVRPQPIRATEPVNTNSIPPVRQLLHYFDSVYQKKTLTGFATTTIDGVSYSGLNYPVTGKREAIQALDMQWTDLTPAGMQQIVDDYFRTGTILSFQYHWFFNGQSAWVSERSNQVSVANMLTEGTVEQAQARLELARVADALKYLDDRGVPVLWRPLHELSGGWFWWTDLAHPENTAALYRMIYHYFTNERHLNNLLWVWNTGGNIDARFYPGDQYVDIIGDDIYNSDYRNGRNEYWNSWNALKNVAPGKMIALCECGELPNPDLMESGGTPPWLYAMMWFGAGQYGNPRDWTIYTVRHNWMITRDELPALTSHGNISPQVGILSPLDNGEGRFNAAWPVIRAFAADLDGTIDRVEFLANGSKIGVVTQPPYDFTFTNASPGIYNMSAVAYDNAGASSKSQTVRISYAVADLALGRPVMTSSAASGNSGSAAVDGDYWTSWVSDNSATNAENQWIYVDLGTTNLVGEVDLSWYWKVFGQDYSIDVATTAPNTDSSWSTVGQVQNAPIDEYPNKAFHRVTFAPVLARYVRLHATRRAQWQTWGGYDLASLEIPAPLSALGSNVAPVISSPAAASPTNTLSHSAMLQVTAADANRDFLTYTWSVSAGDTNAVTFDPNGTIYSRQTTVRLARAGVYTLRVTVSDGRGGTATSDVAVTQVAFDGAILTDDRSSQNGNGLGSVDSVSKWNTFAMRFVLEQPLSVQSAILRVYRSASDTAPIVATVSEGASDAWTEGSGPVPSGTAAIASQTVGRGGVWMSFDVTDFIRSRAASGGVATLVLSTDQGSWNTSVHTRNNPANPPQLIISQGAVRLQVSPSGNHLLLSWPNWAASYGLYSAADLAGSTWRAIASGPLDNGTNFIFPFEATNRSQLFQLRESP